MHISITVNRQTDVQNKIYNHLLFLYKTWKVYVENISCHNENGAKSQIEGLLWQATLGLVTPKVNYLWIKYASFMLKTIQDAVSLQKWRRTGGNVIPVRLPCMFHFRFLHWKVFSSWELEIVTMKTELLCSDRYRYMQILKKKITLRLFLIIEYFLYRIW